MRMLRSLVCGLAILTAVHAADGMVTPAYPPLVESPVDTVWLSESRPLQGKIDDERPDGTLVLTVDGVTQTLNAKQYVRIEHRCMADEAVKRRATAALAARDWDDVVRTVRWGVQHHADVAVVDAVLEAIAVMPTQTVLAEVALGVWAEKPDPAREEALVRTVLRADVHWRLGRQHLVKLLMAAKRDDDAMTALRDWLQVAPAELEAIRPLAGLEEQRGNLRVAVELWRRGWEGRQDGVSGIAYARLLVRRGEPERAAEVAIALQARADTAAAGRGLLGAVRTVQGRTDEALPLLAAALTGDLSPDLAAMVRYDQALCWWRQGRMAEARAAWSELSLPEAAQAVATVDRQPLPQADVQGAPGLSADRIALHNTMLALERDPTAPLPAEVVRQPGRPAQLVRAVSTAFAGTLAPSDLRLLVAIEDPVALRWQAYAHLVAKRYDQALAVLARLPENDGYALAYRLHIATERRDVAMATALWRRVQDAPDAPHAWLARVAPGFDAVDRVNVQEGFDQEGVAPPSGWTYLAPGTGIQLYQRGGRLWFDGEQRLGGAVTRACRTVMTTDLRRVVARFDVAGLASAIIGIEIMDTSRMNGIAVGVRSDGAQAWRECRQGVWSPWTTLSERQRPGMAMLAVDCSRGSVRLMLPSEPDKPRRLGAWSGADQKELSVALFGSADAGARWKGGVDDVRIELAKSGSAF
jgi:tetratricopeptide (TPR) repeat protein